MKKIFYIFLSRPVTASMFFFSVIIVGLISAFNLPVELSPEVEYPRLTITVSWTKTSPEAVEAYLTSPIEAELSTITGLKKISSTSSEGLAKITLEFHPDTNIDFARIEITEKLSSLKKELPYGTSSPSVSQYVPSEFQELQGFLVYTISGDQSANEIRKYVKENLVYPLKAIDGVSDVVVRGGNEREISIIIDYEKAKNYQISNADIERTVEKTEIIKNAGSIKNNQSNVYVKIDNTVKDISLIEEQTIKSLPDGNSIKIKDIGKVYDDFKETESFYRINGKETVSLIISKELGKNTLEIAGKVKEKTNELVLNFPKGYQLIKEVDKSETISKELDELFSSAVYSILIIIVVLIVIFRNVRYTFIILISIVFSLLFAFLLFYLFNLPLNILTIAAFILGFGFMVDNSIVVVDYIDKHYTGRGIKFLTVILKTIFPPVFASTFTTIAVFVPLLFLTGELKLYFEQFALGVVFTLLASLIVSFTFVPLLYIKLTKRTILVKKYNRAAFNIYSFILNKILRFKKISLALLILMIGLPVWLIPNRIDTPVIGDFYNSIFDSEFYNDAKPYINYALGGSLNLFFNYIYRGEPWSFGEETYLYVRLELPNGNTIDRLNELTKDFEKEILVYKTNIKNVITNVFDEENASIRIEFDKEQGITAFPYILKNYLTSYSVRLGGLIVSIYGFGPGFSSGGGGMINNFMVSVKGFNYEKVRTLAANFRGVIIKNPRIDNVDIDKSRYYWAKDTYEIVGQIDRSKLQGTNAAVNDIYNTIAKTTGGNLTWNRFRIGNDEVPYNIKFSNYKNIQMDELQNTLLQGSDKNKLKIKNLVAFDERKVMSSINREDQQYIRNVAFEYKGPFKYGDQFVEASINKLSIPEGYSVEKRNYRFSFGEKDEIDIWNILAMAVILLFMITASLFESIKKPILIITAIPFAIIGTIFLFYFAEYNIDRGAYAGMLLLIGLSVNNSIILVDYLSNHLTQTDFNKLIQLSYTRLRPIFTTTITTIAALIPLLIGSDSNFWKSLSLSIIGGIFLSAVIVILVIPPAFYSLKKRKFI